MLFMRILTLMFILALATPASAKLRGSYLRDQYRVCLYDDTKGDYTNATERSITIDRDDQCPEKPAPPVVPALATLESSSIVNGQRLCTYTYVNRKYVKTIELGLSCTYVPR